MAARNGRGTIKVLQETEPLQILDWTESVPHPVLVKAGQREYSFSTDIDPVRIERIGDWLTSYQESREKKTKPDMEELYRIVGDVLTHAEDGTGVSQDEAKKLGFVFCMRLINFLAQPLSSLGQETSPSV